MALDPNRFTRKTQEAFGAAQALARDAGNTEIAPEHFLRALLDQPEGIVVGVIERIGVDPSAVVRRVGAGRVDGECPQPRVRVVIAVAKPIDLGRVGGIEFGQSAEGAPTQVHVITGEVVANF